MLAPFVIAGIATPYSAFSANGPGRRSAVGASLQRDVVASGQIAGNGLDGLPRRTAASAGPSNIRRACMSEIRSVTLSYSARAVSFPARSAPGITSCATTPCCWSIGTPARRLIGCASAAS